MPLTDPLGDMLTRIRNGQQARKDSVLSPASKLRARVLDGVGGHRVHREDEVTAARLELLRALEGSGVVQPRVSISTRSAPRSTRRSWPQSVHPGR